MLTLNVKKSNYMTYSPDARGQPPVNKQLSIHTSNCKFFAESGRNDDCVCEPLDRVTSVKYLGIIVDNNLKWNSHINYLVSRLRNLIFQFYRINKIKHLYVIRLIYNAYAKSFFQYCIEVWGGAMNAHINKLFVIQKHIIRAALGRPRLYPSKLIFDELRALTIRQLYIRNLIIYLNHNKKLFITRNLSYRIRPLGNSICIPAFNKRICRHQTYYICCKLLNIIPIDFVYSKLRISNLNNITFWVKEHFYFKMVH